MIHPWFKKPQVWELSRLCPETLTKLYVHELSLRPKGSKVPKKFQGTFLVFVCKFVCYCNTYSLLYHGVVEKPVQLAGRFHSWCFFAWQESKAILTFVFKLSKYATHTKKLVVCVWHQCYNCIQAGTQMQKRVHETYKRLVRTDKDDLLTYALSILILSVEEVGEINNI